MNRHLSFVRFLDDGAKSLGVLDTGNLHPKVSTVGKAGRTRDELRPDDAEVAPQG